jgi:hypothetical protein
MTFPRFLQVLKLPEDLRELKPASIHLDRPFSAVTLNPTSW